MTNQSLLILTGGIGRRMEFVEKSLIPFKNQTIIEYMINSLKAEFDEIIISVRDKTQKESLASLLTNENAIIVEDYYQNVGPLAGILEGFKISKSEYIFVTACDMPFINRKVVKFLFECAKGHDIALPRWNNKKIEPLHAVYKRKSMILEIENAIKIKETKIFAPISKLNSIFFVDMKKIQKIDENLLTFTNINTLKDLKKLKYVQ